MLRLIYTALAYLLLPFVLGAMLWRGLRDRDYWHRLGERFGFGPAYPRPTVWVHAVSVGEVQASAGLVRELSKRYADMPLVLTTVTPTGAQLARSLFADSVHVRYVPYDLPGSVRRFFRRVNPRLAIILETELWPNLYHECGRRGIPLVLASARISPRSVRRYRLLVPLFRNALANGIVIAAQSSADAERFISIGANPRRTHVTGNVKFDFEVPQAMRAAGQQLRSQHAQSRRVWIAGSTHEGEEEIVLDAHAQVRRDCPDALLLLAPRHRNRFDSVAQLLKRRGVSFVTRSSQARAAGQTEVLLIDSLGELVAFYAAADVAFVGGSLMPVGGHNLLEPAALSMPILTGPNNFNAESIAKLLLDVGAATIVHDAAELAAQVALLLTDPDKRTAAGSRGRRTLDESRGALGRLLDLIDPFLHHRPAGNGGTE